MAERIFPGPIPQVEINGNRVVPKGTKIFPVRRPIQSSDQLGIFVNKPCSKTRRQT